MTFNLTIFFISLSPFIEKQLGRRLISSSNLSLWANFIVHSFWYALKLIIWNLVWKKILKALVTYLHDKLDFSDSPVIVFLLSASKKASFSNQDWYKIAVLKKFFTAIRYADFIAQKILETIETKWRQFWLLLPKEEDLCCPTFSNLDSNSWHVGPLNLHAIRCNL